MFFTTFIHQVPFTGGTTFGWCETVKTAVFFGKFNFEFLVWTGHTLRIDPDL